MYIVIKNINEHIKNNITHMQKIINYDSDTNHMDIIDMWDNSIVLYVSCKLFEIIQDIIENIQLPQKYTFNNLEKIIDVRNTLLLQIIFDDCDDCKNIIHNNIFIMNNIYDTYIYELTYLRRFHFHIFIDTLNTYTCISIKRKLLND